MTVRPTIVGRVRSLISSLNRVEVPKVLLLANASFFITLSIFGGNIEEHPWMVSGIMITGILAVWWEMFINRALEEERRERGQFIEYSYDDWRDYWQ